MALPKMRGIKAWIRWEKSPAYTSPSSCLCINNPMSLQHHPRQLSVCLPGQTLFPGNKVLVNFIPISLFSGLIQIKAMRAEQQQKEYVQEYCCFSGYKPLTWEPSHTWMKGSCRTASPVNPILPQSDNWCVVYDLGH